VWHEVDFRAIHARKSEFHSVYLTGGKMQDQDIVEVVELESDGIGEFDALAVCRDPDPN
jgi:hypothetical protein